MAKLCDWIVIHHQIESKMERLTKQSPIVSSVNPRDRFQYQNTTLSVEPLPYGRHKEWCMYCNDKLFVNCACNSFWTHAGILLIGPLGTNFSEILIEIHILSFKKMHLKMSAGKWRPFCLGLYVLNTQITSFNEWRNKTYIMFVLTWHNECINKKHDIHTVTVLHMLCICSGDDAANKCAVHSRKCHWLYRHVESYIWIVQYKNIHSDIYGWSCEKICSPHTCGICYW